MKILKFKVQNFKKINDTGWVTCADLTAFVGKNEAGKSAIFRGLSKLNPSDNEQYDGLKEFPRRRYTDEFKKQDWPVSSVEFELTDDEVHELSEICPLLENIKSVICTRNYSWSLNVEFQGELLFVDVSNKEFLNLLKRCHSILEKSTSPEGQGEQLSSIKNKLLPFITEKIQGLNELPKEDNVESKLIENVSNTIMAQFNEEWQKKYFNKIIDDLTKFKKDFYDINSLSKAEEWVKNNLPKFIYFDRYDVIDSAVYIPTFIQQLSENPSAPRLRTTKCLFHHVGLDLDRIQKLDPSNLKSVDKISRYADERSILMSSASTAMTNKFSEWWEQRRHKFRYNIDGPFFRVWVSDDLDPSEIELDQRSLGMQYFFSFYLIFLEEAKETHKNSILLLDEVGLQLHGTAQQKIIKFLAKLSKQNQLLYTTHSAFMIDGDNLHNIRVVYEEKTDGSTKVSEDVWPKDKDALFPLQAALGYSIAQTLFFSKRQLVVEGIIDYWILKAMNEILPTTGRSSLSQDTVIIPSGGVNKLMPLISLLVAHNIKLAILLDGDEPGIRKGKEVESKLLLKCLFMNKFIDKGEAELEDLFPEEFYLEAVKEAYPTITLNFSMEEKKIECITKRVDAIFNRKGGVSFEKWQPAKVIVDWILKGEKELPKESLDRFEQILKEVNNILSTK